MRKRPIECKFRLSQDEYDLLQEKLQDADMSRNAYLVRLISGATIFPKEPLKELVLQYKMMERLLRGIGTNVNQIAKVANANQATPSAALLTFYELEGGEIRTESPTKENALKSQHFSVRISDI